MNKSNLKTITSNLIITLQGKKKETLTEIADAIALAELNDVINKMCCEY